MKYLGTFYTKNNNGVIMQNSLFEHVPHSLRSYLRYLRNRQMAQNGLLDNHVKPISADVPLDVAFCKIYKPIDDTETDHTIVNILCDVLNGIMEVHERGLVHRDLKPDNVLIDDDKAPSVAKVCDLGSAKKINRLCLTNNSDMDLKAEPSTPYVCSRWYRAPELLFGRTFYNASVDNWSFGCMCAEMLLLRPLFAANDESDAKQVITLIDVLGSPSRAEAKRILEASPCDAIRKQLEALFQIMRSKGSLRMILTSIAKGNSRLMAVANVAYNLLRW